MNYTLWRGLGVLAVCWAMVGGMKVAAASSPGAGARAEVVPRIMYVSGAHLWLRPVDSGAAHLVRTPWPMAHGADAFQGLAWSPDGRRVAVDDGTSRLAVIRLDTNHITTLLNPRCGKNCQTPQYEWSPNGRYLAYLRPIGKGEASRLMVWDSARGVSRRLTGGVTTYFTGIVWSHDSSRIVVSTGPFDVIRQVYPFAEVVDLEGHTRLLGKGTQSAWSPDDRFVASVVPNECGANTCIDREVVRPASGGATVTLARHMVSNFEDIEWARLAQGYGFNRWVLNSAGNIVHAVAGPNERVDSWAPDGLHLAVQSYHPYQETPDALFISTPQHARVHLFTAGRKNSCGACSKDVYQVVWAGSLVAFVTPTYPTPQNKVVNPSLYVANIDGSSETRINVVVKSDIELLGFVESGTGLIFRTGHTIYRYAIGSHALNAVASGTLQNYGSALLDPSLVPPQTP